MMNFEEILNAFAQYLKQDDVIEIVMTQHGYTVLMWDRKQKNWWLAECCTTPEKLLDVLLESYGLYMEEKRCCCRRDLTKAEKAEIDAELYRIKTLCEQK